MYRKIPPIKKPKYRSAHGGEQGPRLLSSVSPEEHGVKVGRGVPRTAVCRARPQVQPRARVHAACLRWCWTRRCPPLLWVPLGALARDPGCRNLSGGHGRKGGVRCSPGSQAGSPWAPILWPSTHPQLSTGGRSSSRQGTPDGCEFEGLGRAGGGVLPRSEGPLTLGHRLSEKSGRCRAGSR